MELCKDIAAAHHAVLQGEYGAMRRGLRIKARPAGLLQMLLCEKAPECPARQLSHQDGSLGVRRLSLSLGRALLRVRILSATLTNAESRNMAATVGALCSICTAGVGEAG